MVANVTECVHAISTLAIQVEHAQNTIFSYMPKNVNEILKSTE